MPEFPHPLSIETPAGCEGWEEMYPYWALFDERRRESDENRLWFWNSQHFPFPMPAFDMVEVDHPYYTLGGWQNRAFAVPPAMGVDYRVVNGYVYISPNPVTDPDKIAERAGLLREARRPLLPELGRAVRAAGASKMEALNREVEAIEVPDLPEYEPDEVVFGEQNLSNIDLLRAYLPHAPLRGDDVAAPLRVPAARLRRLPDLRRVRAATRCRTSPTSTSRRWWRASTWCCSAPTPSCAGWRGWRSRPAWTARSSRAARPRRSTPRWPSSDEGRSWLDELEKIKDPWFNMGTGDGLYHYYGSWHDDPSIPYASLIGHVAALKAGQRHRAPDRGAGEGARPAGGGVRRAARRGVAPGLPGAARALAHGLPVRRGAQVLLRLLVPVALLQQGARVRRAARQARLPRGGRGHLPALPPRGDGGARGAVADVVDRRPAARPAPLAADRGPPQGAARAARRVDAAARPRRGCPRR